MILWQVYNDTAIFNVTRDRHVCELVPLSGDCLQGPLDCGVSLSQAEFHRGLTTDRFVIYGIWWVMLPQVIDAECCILNQCFIRQKLNCVCVWQLHVVNWAQEIHRCTPHQVSYKVMPKANLQRHLALLWNYTGEKIIQKDKFHNKIDFAANPYKHWFIYSLLFIFWAIYYNSENNREATPKLNDESRI